MTKGKVDLGSQGIFTIPQCPLCLEAMTLSIDNRAFLCHKDRIGIRITDPMVGKWDKHDEKLTCPHCDAEMRYFCTSTGYMQAKCPKCGAKISGTPVIEDMDKPDDNRS